MHRFEWRVPRRFAIARTESDWSTVGVSTTSGGPGKAVAARPIGGTDFSSFIYLGRREARSGLIEIDAVSAFAETPELGGLSDVDGLAKRLRSIARPSAVAAELEVGIPRVLGASTPREDAIGLLKLASEIEHAVMVQYLYASLSVRSTVAHTLLRVAVQEMGHLVTLQNLLMALGGFGADGLPCELHLGRRSLRAGSPLDPLRVSLERVSAVSLARAVLLERPLKLPDVETEARVAELRVVARAAGFDPRPVSAVYMALRWLFANDEARFGDELGVELGFEPGWHVSDDDFAPQASVLAYATDIVEWGGYPGLIVLPATDTAGALEAIEAVMAQGEGHLAQDEAHFAELLKLANAFDAGDIRRIKDLPRSPVVGDAGEPEDPAASEITHPYTRLWARLFNLRYSMLILDLGWALSQARQTEARQVLIKEVCILGMSQVLDGVGKKLINMALDEQTDRVAGPPYELRRDVLPRRRTEYRSRYGDIFQRQGEVVRCIESRAEFASDAGGQSLLQSLLAVDKVRELYLP